MTSEIDKLKHFHVEDYSGTNFTDDLNDGKGEGGPDDWMYQQVIEAVAVFASHLNPYYRSAYNVSKRRK